MSHTVGLPSFLSSLMIHVLLIVVLPWLAQTFRPPKIASPFKNNRPIKIKSLDQKTLEKVRRWGKKNGAQHNRTFVPEKNERPKFNLSELGKTQAPKRPTNIKATGPQSPPASSLQGSGLQATKRTILSRKMRQMSKSLHTEELSARPYSSLLSKKAFSIDVEPPEGISEDEFNSFEKIYYGFLKRTFVTSLNAINSQVLKIERRNPKIIQKIVKGHYFLKGKLSFDQEGNLTSLKIYKASDDLDVYQVFSELLKAIQKIPNPPRSLLREDKFHIYIDIRS